MNKHMPRSQMHLQTLKQTHVMKSFVQKGGIKPVPHTCPSVCRLCTPNLQLISGEAFVFRPLSAIDLSKRDLLHQFAVFSRFYQYRVEGHTLSQHPLWSWSVRLSWVTDYFQTVTEAQVSKPSPTDKRVEAVVAQAGSPPSAVSEEKEGRGFSRPLCKPGVSRPRVHKAGICG